MKLSNSAKHSLRICLPSRTIEVPAEGSVEVSKEEASALQSVLAIKARFDARTLSITA